MTEEAKEPEVEHLVFESRPLQFDSFGRIVLGFRLWAWARLLGVHDVIVSSVSRPRHSLVFMLVSDLAQSTWQARFIATSFNFVVKVMERLYLCW